MLVRYLIHAFEISLIMQGVPCIINNYLRLL